MAQLIFEFPFENMKDFTSAIDNPYCRCDIENLNTVNLLSAKASFAKIVFLARHFGVGNVRDELSNRQSGLELPNLDVFGDGHQGRTASRLAQHDYDRT